MQLSDFQWSDIITKVVAAIIILVITAVIAKVVKKLLTSALGKVKTLQRSSEGGESLAASLGTIGSLIVWLFGLLAIINLFNLTQVTTPLGNMLDGVMGALPNILGAGLVMFIGFVLAKIARQLVVTALQAAGADRFLDRLGDRASSAVESTGTHAAGNGEPSEAPAARENTGAASGPGGILISTMVGQLVFAVILLVVAIAALQVLDIHAISVPASHMLSVILDSLPLILGAAILLGIGGFIAKFAGQLIETVLRGLHVESALERAGISSGSADLPAIATRIVQIAIVLFFAIAATNMLEFPELTHMLDTILGVAARVVFGAVIILAGILVAKVVASFATGTAATVVRFATIILFAAIGLKYMGLANSIINLGFGALVVGGAAAAALAFGLGGREAAARQLETIQRGRENAEG